MKPAALVATLAAMLAATLVTTGTAAAAAPDAPADDARSPEAAVLLSAAPTAAFAGMMLAGVVGADDQDSGTSVNLILGGFAGVMVAPSIGHWYGTGSPFTVGSAIRLGGAGLTLAGGALLATSTLGNAITTSYDDSGEDTIDTGPYEIMFWGGLAAVGAGAVYDIVTAHGATERANARRALRFSVAPTVVSSPTGQQAMGLGIGGSF